mmetsp:Transcript_27625/g.69650  ORF Transcript_27625/g.69650 Transcript_27625/m.69650 type:complete len:272 (-) Transcript_27625:3265-4080(-)
MSSTAPSMTSSWGRFPSDGISFLIESTTATAAPPGVLTPLQPDSSSSNATRLLLVVVRELDDVADLIFPPEGAPSICSCLTTTLCCCWLRVSFLSFLLRIFNFLMLTRPPLSCSFSISPPSRSSEDELSSKTITASHSSSSRSSCFFREQDALFDAEARRDRDGDDARAALSSSIMVCSRRPCSGRVTGKLRLISPSAASFPFSRSTFELLAPTTSSTAISLSCCCFCLLLTFMPGPRSTSCSASSCPSTPVPLFSTSSWSSLSSAPLVRT